MMWKGITRLHPNKYKIKNISGYQTIFADKKQKQKKPQNLNSS